MVKPPVQVLHLITELSLGGAQIVLLRLLQQADRSEFQPRVACLFNGGGQVAQQIRLLDIPVHDLRMSAKWRLDALGRLYQLLSQEHPNILHTWMFHANLPGRLLGRLARIPIIISSEHTMGQEGPGRLWLNRLTAPLANRVICVTPQVADFAQHMIRIAPEKLVVIPNGIDEASFQDLPSKDLARLQLSLPVAGVLIGAAGRPRQVKGYPYLLQAFALLAEAHPEAHLVFAGEGPDRTSLIQLARDLGLAGRVTFLDDLEDISILYAALDILAIPSLHEGMGLVALEAMAAGVPVVASQVGGLPEVVEGDVTGLLVPPAAPAELAAAMVRLLEDPTLRESMGQAGRRRVAAHFSIARNVEMTQNLYRELLVSHF